MNALMFLFASLQTSVLAAAASHEASQWQLKWDLELVNIVFGVSILLGTKLQKLCTLHQMLSKLKIRHCIFHIYQGPIIDQINALDDGTDLLEKVAG